MCDSMKPLGIPGPDERTRHATAVAAGPGGTAPAGHGGGGGGGVAGRRGPSLRGLPAVGERLGPTPARAGGTRAAFPPQGPSREYSPEALSGGDGRPSDHGRLSRSAEAPVCALDPRGRPRPDHHTLWRAAVGLDGGAVLSTSIPCMWPPPWSGGCSGIGGGFVCSSCPATVPN